MIFVNGDNKWQLLSLYIMAEMQKNNPLHGITLEFILNHLVAQYGWDGLAREIRINSFITNPSINSSLQFLRKTPWARKKVEDLYLKVMK